MRARLWRFWHIMLRMMAGLALLELRMRAIAPMARDTRHKHLARGIDFGCQEHAHDTLRDGQTARAGAARYYTRHRRWRDM